MYFCLGLAVDICANKKKNKNLSQSDLGTREISQERAFQGNVSEYLKGDGKGQGLP